MSSRKGIIIREPGEQSQDRLPPTNKGKGKDTARSVPAKKSKGFSPNAQGSSSLPKDKATLGKESKKSSKEALLSDPFEAFIPLPTTEDVIFLLEDDLQWRNDPWYVASRYFGRNDNYPALFMKTREYAKAILMDTGSIHIYPIDKHSGDKKVFISEIKLPIDYGFNPNEPRIVQGTRDMFYNYWDYVQAWKNVFLFQDEKNRHSWFMRFNPSFNLKRLPQWFPFWWLTHGLLEKGLPPELQERFLLFCKYLDNDYFAQKYVQPLYEKPHMQKQMYMLHFMVKYRLPWILAWRYEIQDCPIGAKLIRRYLSKWWTTFHLDDYIDSKGNLVPSILPVIDRDLEMFQRHHDDVVRASLATNLARAADPADPLSIVRHLIQSQNEDFKKKFLEFADFISQEDEDPDPYPRRITFPGPTDDTSISDQSEYVQNPDYVHAAEFQDAQDPAMDEDEAQSFADKMLVDEKDFVLQKPKPKKVVQKSKWAQPSTSSSQAEDNKDFPKLPSPKRQP